MMFVLGVISLILAGVFTYKAINEITYCSGARMRTAALRKSKIGIVWFSISAMFLLIVFAALILPIVLVVIGIVIIYLLIQKKRKGKESPENTIIDVEYTEE